MQDDSKKLNLYQTFAEMAKVISSTMGPEGRFTALVSNGTNMITKDGATVAEAMSSMGSLNINEILCASLLKDITSSANRLGDGTTTATALASAMISYLTEDLTKTVERSEELLKEKDAVIKAIKNKSVRSDHLLEHVIATAGHPSTNKLVAEGLRYSKNITVSRGALGDFDELDVRDGIYIEADVIPDFSNIFSMEKTLFLLLEGDLTRTGDLDIILRQALQDSPTKGNVVIMARGFSDEVVHLMLDLEARSNVKVLPVVAPWKGVKVRESFYRDLCALTSAKSIKVEDLERSLSPQHFGQTDIESSVNSITLTNTAIDKEETNKRMDAIFKEMPTVSNAKLRELEARLGLYTGKASIVKVGGKTLSDQMEKLVRTQDAASSGKAFLNGGAIKGGGVGIITATNGLKGKLPELLETPFRVILENAKVSEETIDELVSLLRNEDLEEVYIDVPKGILEHGKGDVWDSTEVIISSIEAAVSLAVTLSRVESLI